MRRSPSGASLGRSEVLASLATVRNTVVKKLAVSGVPRSGKPQEVIEAFGISASTIVEACKDILKM